MWKIRFVTVSWYSNLLHFWLSCIVNDPVRTKSLKHRRYFRFPVTPTGWFGEVAGSNPCRTNTQGPISVSRAARFSGQSRFVTQSRETDERDFPRPFLSIA